MRTRYTFYVDDDQRAALAAIKTRDGISESEQIRRALSAWIALKGVSTTGTKKKPGRKRAATRKRP